MPSLTFLGFKVGMLCTAPNGTRTGTGTPYPHSVKHGGLTHSVKHGGKIALVENRIFLAYTLVENKMGSTP